jgi:single-strand DNA-binding protein
VSDTRVTVVGNVVNSPRRVRLQHGTVTNFRLAATERRFDSTTQAWVDGATLWCDVECFNDLGANVSASVSKGDPVIVVGSITTRSWEGEKGPGSTTQIRASAVGPNLSRGAADFRRITRSQQMEQPPAPEEGSGEEYVESSPALEGADYEAGSAALYELDSDTRAPEPALR